MSKKHAPKISVCIATFNMKKYLWSAVESCFDQTEKDIEIIIYDDCSTDGTDKIPWLKTIPQVRYIRGEVNKGVGEGFNAAIKEANGEFVVLMCADDILCEKYYFSDACEVLAKKKTVGHMTRYYYQFISGTYAKTPVRAWRTGEILIQANNPSGLIFRRTALEGCECSNKMFIETSQLVSQVIGKGWGTAICLYDAVAVRVHESTSTRKDYWLKHRVSSPLEDWTALGAKDIAKDYVSFIQIKNGFTMDAVWEEIRAFLKYRPRNWLSPRFWFFATVAVVTPRAILRKIPDIYRRTWGRWTTRRVMR